MGEFPAYTPPKKRKSNNDFEVVSLDRTQPAGRNSESFVALDYNSDSSTDQFSTQTSRKGPLPDIVKSTRVSAKRLKFNSSNSESNEEIVENRKPNPEHKFGDKFLKCEREKLTSSQRMNNVTKKVNAMQEKRFNQSDSGSESDTPMTSLKKKGKRELVPPVKGFPKKGEGNDNVRDRKLHEVHTAKSAGRLPEFRGTAMLDPIAETSIGVRYGADILAELFASENSSEESSDAEHDMEDKKTRNTDILDFTNMQGAIDSLLGLKEGVEGNSESKKQTEKKAKTDKSVDLDSEMESEEESEPEENNTEQVTVVRQHEPKGSGRDETESSDSETETDTGMSESDDSDHDDDEKSISSTGKLQKVQIFKKTDQRGPKEIMADAYTSDSSDSELESNCNLKEMVMESGNVIPKQSSKRNFLSNVSVISEFSSGFTETKVEKHKICDSSDSEEDLLDMVNSGKMKKVREYEKKAMDDNPGKKGKGIKKVEKPEKEDKLEEDKNQMVKSGRPKSNEAIKSKSNDDTKTSERKPKTKQEKHALDNERRMESMRQKELEVRNHKAAIKKALASIVSVTS